MPKTLLKDGIQFECPEKAKALKLWSDGKKKNLQIGYGRQWDNLRCH